MIVSHSTTPEVAAPPYKQEVEDQEEASAAILIAVAGATVAGPTNPVLGVMVDISPQKYQTAFQKPAPKSPYSLLITF